MFLFLFGEKRICSGYLKCGTLNGDNYEYQLQNEVAESVGSSNFYLYEDGLNVGYTWIEKSLEKPMEKDSFILSGLICGLK